VALEEIIMSDNKGKRVVYNLEEGKELEDPKLSSAPQQKETILLDANGNRMKLKDIIANAPKLSGNKK